MTWSEYTRARQLLAEEQVGVPHRAAIEAEEAEFARSKAALRRDSEPR